jgi:disulfide bond formation protein DsbB
MPFAYTNRPLFFAVALACAGMLGYALYAEHVLGLEPCPLCMFQRVAVLLLGLVALAAALHAPGALGTRLYGCGGFLAAGLGAAVAGRHVWLQSLPKDQLPSCAPPLDFMWNNFPFGQMLKTVLMTSGECANIDWQFLGLSMPVWTLLCFLTLAVLMVIVVLFPPARPARSEELPG